MADIYEVCFSFNGEASHAYFEFKRNAIEFAKMLDSNEISVTVIDHFESERPGAYVSIYP